jgi:thiamine kinase-like enzyme
MIEEDRLVHPDILQEALHLLKDHFASDIKIKSIKFLSEADRRNVLLRITLTSPLSTVPKSIILKQSLPEPSDSDDKDAYARFSRDWAGLKFISGIEKNVHNVPKFYGGSKQQRFILIEDLGNKHISLVDSLTLPNESKAIEALGRFMKALGSFHGESFGITNRYEQILKKINPQVETLQENLDFCFNDLLPTLEFANQNLGLSISANLINEARHIIQSVHLPGPFTVLTHGDICPDNVFDHEDSRDLQLIDFEWGSVRNALLDATYLRMSMPTCWCAKAIPTPIIEPLELIYRNELKQLIPAASDDLAYSTAYTEACGFWVLQQTLHFLNSTLEIDRVGPSGPAPEHSLWKPEDNWVRPRVLSRLQAFVDVATKHNQVPNLRLMSATMLKKLSRLWPDVNPLEFYPAFQVTEDKL